MQTASTRTAVSVKPRARWSTRQPWRRSRPTSSMKLRTRGGRASVTPSRLDRKAREISRSSYGGCTRAGSHGAGSGHFSRISRCAGWEIRLQPDSPTLCDNSVWRQTMKRSFVWSTCLAAALSVGLAAQSGGSGTQGSGSQGSGSQGSSSRSKGSQGKGDQTVTVTGCVESAAQAGTSGTSGSTAGGSGASGSGGSGSTASGGSGSGSKSGSARGQYVLTNVSWGSGGSGSSGASGSGGSGTGTTATSGSGGSGSGAGSGSGSGSSSASGSGSGDQIMLTGSNLQQHVGHRVEIRGRMQNAGGSSMSGMSGGGSGTSGSGSSGSGTSGSGTTSGSGSSASGSGSSASGGSGSSGSSMGTGMAMGGGTLRVNSVRMLSSTCSGSR